MKIVLFFAIAVCACAAEVEKEKKAEPQESKDKRQTQDEFIPSLPAHLYRTSRKQDPVAPVEEPQDDDRVIISSRADSKEYRPGQVFSLNPHELYELQPERKAPSSSQLSQPLYTSPQQEHLHNLQQIHFLEPQTARQVGAQPIRPSPEAPLNQQYQEGAPNPQQSLQQLILQAFGGRQVGAQTVAPASTQAPLSANPHLHNRFNYPQQDPTEYLRQLITLHALISGHNLAFSAPAPVPYSTKTYLTPQASGSPQFRQQKEEQIERQPDHLYLQSSDGQVYVTTTPLVPLLRIKNTQSQRPQPARYDLQQILLLNSLAQTTSRPAPTIAALPLTSTQPLHHEYDDDSEQNTEPIVLIGMKGRSLQLETTPNPLLETTPIPSNDQLQDLDSLPPTAQQFRELPLVNELPQKQSQYVEAQNTSTPDVKPRAHIENDQQPLSNPIPKASQVASHAVITRPHYSSNGGEASVGAALSVSDTGVSAADSFDHELLALLGQAPVRPDAQAHQQTASVAPPHYQQVAPQTVAPLYQQVDRYITKPSKKATKLRPKVHSHVSPPQSSAAPQQYLIETTNVQQPQPLQQQYRPVLQPQRAPQALRYVPVPSTQAFAQQALYERPEAQGLKVVAAPKLQQPHPQLGYRLYQYQQPETTPKQYRILAPKARPEQRVPASSIERPVTYLKRYPDVEKMRAVKIYDPVPRDGPQQSAPLLGDQYYLRPVYRTNEQRDRYQLAPSARPEQPQLLDTSKPHSAIYVSKNLATKKAKSQPPKAEQSSEQTEESRGQSIEERRAQLPPPKNNRAYTPEEFAALVAAGYSVTPIPVAPLGHPGHPVAQAQSRSSADHAPAPEPLPTQRRTLYARRQHLHVSGDDAP